jgi:hypothetical protein
VQVPLSGNRSDSQLEERLLLWLDYNPQVASYARGDIGQEFATTYRLPIPKHALFAIGYTFEGKPHEYLPDGELLPVTNYLPDVERIKQNGVKVFLGVGEWALSRKTWHLQVAQILAEQLGCELVRFPGHHGSYMDMPQEWAATLRRVLHQAEA